jgi:UDP-N-acetylglucosamine--N-acetylmuramyl-(pentapeptide) pyrophosphoryl-undecaprenol N-acetylglucosamine transferase
MIANRVLEAFPNTFKASAKVCYTGNPLRREIAELKSIPSTGKVKHEGINILVLGGSQGAAAINDVMPEALKNAALNAVSVMHQTGKQKLKQTIANYEKAGFKPSASLRVSSFIEDMPKAYEWCDLVICRSGASTVSEIAAAGKPSILIPYPYHRDNQQFFNAKWLEKAGAAVIICQQDLTADSLSKKIHELVNVAGNLLKMGNNAQSVAILDADVVIANACLELANA